MGITSASQQYAISTASTVNKTPVSSVSSTVKTITTSEHGNSLTTPKPAQGYALINRYTGETLKYGETTMGPSRYTNKYLNSIGADMKIMAEGTKYEMHYWQHKMIIDYTKANGARPPLNKSDW